MSIALAIMPDVGAVSACDALGVSRATLYRRLRPKTTAARAPSPRALTTVERAELHDVLCQERFMDASPAQVHATLLDEGVHLASVSTMYRVLRALRSVRERRAFRRHPNYERPELVATGPNQVWSWDITKVRGPNRRDWFHLYVIIDIFSRKVVGGTLAKTESGSLAVQLIADAAHREGIQPDILTLHADRGAAMRSKTVAELLDDLGVVRTHSRPRVSNDNAFSEAQFKTVKYSPYYPGSFSSVHDGRSYFELFFNWYNDEHHHSGLAMMTPSTVHNGLIDAVLAARQRALDEAYAANPVRFVNGPPRAKRPPTEAWINRPMSHMVLQSGEDGSPSSPLKAENTPSTTRPSPAGPPAQAREACAEGVDGLAEAERRVAAPRSSQRE